MLFAGGLPLLAFPGLNLEFLAWFALVPGLLLIINSPGQREAAVRAWWLGSGYLITALYWMAPEIGPGLLLVGAVFGALWVPFGVAAWRLLRPPVTWRRALAALTVVPSCWLLTEWLRSWQALGGPWAVYGASQWQHPAVLALAAVGGVWLVTFALVMTNVAIVLVLGVRRPARLALGLGAVVAGAGAGPLAFALTPAAPAVRQVTIAMVQPGLVHDPAKRVDASETLTASLSRSGSLGGVRPDLIVWGESSVAFDLALDHSLLRAVEALSAQNGADILVDQDTTLPGKGDEKVAVLVSPAGIEGTYVKTRLVPFGEYIPFRRELGWLTKISKAAAANMIPGTGARLLHPVDRAGRPLPIGVLICFESAFPDMSRVETGQGAQLIVYQSSTPTFQGTWGPDQHASLAALRAAETGRPAVQAALTGDTVAFDARGRQAAWMGQSSRGVVTVRLGLPAVSARTPYDRLGDCVPWAATAIVVIAALILLARSRGFLGGDTSVRERRAAVYDSGNGQRVAT